MMQSKNTVKKNSKEDQDRMNTGNPIYTHL